MHRRCENAPGKRTLVVGAGGEGEKGGADGEIAGEKCAGFMSSRNSVQ